MPLLRRTADSVTPPHPQPRQQPKRNENNISVCTNPVGAARPSSSLKVGVEDAPSPLTTNSTLPIDTMDVEVFERYIMRVLTSLHRLVGKMSSELGGSSGQRPAGLSDAEVTTATYAWTLVRRVTKRIEKLSIMGPILEQKRAVLLSRIAVLDDKGCGGGRPSSQDAAQNQKIQSELLLVEALITKVNSSVCAFKDIETATMSALFRR